MTVSWKLLWAFPSPLSTYLIHTHTILPPAMKRILPFYRTFNLYYPVRPTPVPMQHTLIPHIHTLMPVRRREHRSTSSMQIWAHESFAHPPPRHRCRCRRHRCHYFEREVILPKWFDKFQLEFESFYVSVKIIVLLWLWPSTSWEGAKSGIRPRTTNSCNYTILPLVVRHDTTPDQKSDH